MGEFTANLDKIKTSCQELYHVENRIVLYKGNVEGIRNQLLASGKGVSVLKQELKNIVTDLKQTEQSAQQIKEGLEEIFRLYGSTESNIIKSKEGFKNLEDFSQNGSSSIEIDNGGQLELDWSLWFKNVIITKPYIFPTLLNLYSPVTGLLYIASGIPSSNTDSFHTLSAKTSAEWLGYELSDENPRVTAWVAKASAEVQSEWGYAEGNMYFGKVEGSANVDAGFMKTEKTEEYINGEWGEKESTTFFNVEVEIGTSFSALSGDVKSGIGNDMLGIENQAEVSIGNADAGVKGEFSVGEDGVNAYVKGEAIVSAVEGKVERTFNIFGLEITGKAQGYAGAVGVEGKIGIEDNKFVLEGGVAAIMGISGGIEIGFNDEGWDNFIDTITFWD